MPKSSDKGASPVIRVILRPMDAEQEKKDKAAFAAFLLQTNGDAFAAAQLLFPLNTGVALRVSQFWPFDPIVTAERARLATEMQGNDPEAVKKYVSQKARQMIEDELRVPAKDRLAAMELLAKLHGAIDAEPDGENTRLPPEPTYRVVKSQTE